MGISQRTLWCSSRPGEGRSNESRASEAVEAASGAAQDLDAVMNTNDQPIVCAIYARSERSGASTLENQIAECRHEAHKRGWTVNEDHIGVDRGYASILPMEERPGLADLLRIVPSGARSFNCLIVDTPLRLSRVISEFLSVYGLLSRHGMRLHALSSDRLLQSRGPASDVDVVDAPEAPTT